MTQTLPSHPAAAILMNSDSSDNVQEVIQRQLLISEKINGEEFDLRVQNDPNYPDIVRNSGLRILVVRSFQELTNRDLFDVVIFVKYGLAAIEKNNFGPHGFTISVERMYLSKLFDHK